MGPAGSASPPQPVVAEGGVFRALFDAYPDALIVAGSDGRIVLANPSAHQLLGYAAGELVGKAIDDLVPDGIRPRHAEYRKAFGQMGRLRVRASHHDRSGGTSKIVRKTKITWACKTRSPSHPVSQ